MINRIFLLYTSNCDLGYSTKQISFLKDPQYIILNNHKLIITEKIAY